MKKTLYIFLLFFSTNQLFSQAVPSPDEKFSYLGTFSKDSKKTWGDDDFIQIIFFVVPETNKDPIFIRVFDPDLGGKNDESSNVFNSKTKFSVYGGKGAHSNKDAQLVDPKGNYKSGTLISAKTFSVNDEYDNNWYTIGPLNPSEGELQKENGGYVFKVLIEGLDGDDGNMYKLFLSKSNSENIPVDGGNSFCYEYTTRIPNVKNSVCHLYPFVPNNVIKMKINVFDFDDDGIIRILSIAKKGEIKISKTEGTWSLQEIIISKEELNTSIDIQFIKQKNINNNNISIYLTNQYNEAIPFYSVPIGGIPNYKYKIDVQKAK